MSSATRVTSGRKISTERVSTSPSVLARLGRNLDVVLALLAIYIIWGSTYLAIRIAVQGLPPFLMASARFIIAGGGLYIFLRLRGEPRPNRAQWLGAGIVGTLLLLSGNGIVAFAEQWVDSGLAAIEIATVPLWAALFAGLWGHWPSRIEWAGLTLGIAGVGLLNLEGNLQANPIGAVALLVAAISWALGSVWSRKLSLPSGLMSSATEMIAGGAGLLVLSFAVRERVPTTLQWSSVWALLYLIVFGSLVAFSAYVFLLRRVRPSLATSYAYVNPAVAVGLGVVLAGERISWIGISAMLVILAAVVLVVAGKSRSS